MASFSRRRSRCRSLESSVTSKSSCRTCTTVPTPNPGEAATPSSTLGSSDRRRGAGATAAWAAAGAAGSTPSSAIGTTPSSPSPAVICAVRSATASSASVPKATTCTLSPYRTSMPMIAITLLAFAWSSPRFSVMSLWYLSGEVGQHRRRTGVQADRVGHQDGLRGHLLTDRFGSAVGRRDGGGQGCHRHHIAARGDDAGAGREVRQQVRVGDHHLGEQALRVRGDGIEVERDEFVAGVHQRADLHLEGEALALHVHGVQPDVGEDFQALR